VGGKLTTLHTAENTSFVQYYHITPMGEMVSQWYLIFTYRESRMVTENMITELTQTVSNLKKDVDVLKEDKNYLYKKLEKAYDDRIELRAENHKLKSKVNGQTTEEEECIACSA
tara:strand:+ start:118 stop:459 length:342 start_codon:yes stop_codon:yes gene_type:complete